MPQSETINIDGAKVMGHVTLRLKTKPVFGLFGWRVIVGTILIKAASHVLRCKCDFTNSFRSDQVIRTALVLACRRIADDRQAYEDADTAEGWRDRFITEAQNLS